jgi:hypothetical protein
MNLGSAVPIALFSVLAVMSCDKSTAQPSTPPADGDALAGSDAADSSSAEDAELSWKEMSFDQRKSYMAKKVMPAMKTAFSAHDAELFKGFKCETCHGDDKTFAMPNEGIYPLSANDPVAGAMDYDEKITRFMVEEVVPQMSALLPTESWAAQDQVAAACFACHPSE